MQPYNVKLDAFEGPLDLLLHLIKQAEVDIYDIPVAQIAEQYMNYIHTMQELELDVASEYLVMAATLLAIKSQMLLPKQEDFDEEDWDEEWGEEDPREALIAQLETYRRYKEIAQALKKWADERALSYGKRPSHVMTREGNHLETQALLDVSLADMLQAYGRMKQRLRFESPPESTITTAEWTVDEKITSITALLHHAERPLPFFDLYEKGEKEEQVVSFLALLQLVKDGSITCSQAGNFEDIYIAVRKKE